MSKNWSEYEELFLKDNKELGAAHIAEELNRTTGSVYGKARNLNIKLGKGWTTEDLKFLIDNAEKGSIFIAEALNKKVKSVADKASRLNIKLGKGWTKEDTDFLKNNSELGAIYVAEKLNRTIDSVYSKGSRLGIKFGKPWSDEESKLLEALYPNTCSVELTKKLNRTISSIQSQASKLGIKKDNNKVTGYLYIVFFPELDLYKVGITNNYLVRFKAFGIKCEVLSLLVGKYNDIKKLEKYLLNYIKPYLYNSGQLRSGNTETYRL